MTLTSGVLSFFKPDLLNESSNSDDIDLYCVENLSRRLCMKVVWLNCYIGRILVLCRLDIYIYIFYSCFKNLLEHISLRGLVWPSFYMLKSGKKKVNKP